MAIPLNHHDRSLNRHQQVDDLIQRYNSTWLNKGVAWIVKDAKTNTYTVKTSLGRSFFKVVLTDVEKSMEDAISFLTVNRADIYPESSAHVDFLERLKLSFSIQKCHVSVDQIRIDKVIAGIRSARLATQFTVHERVQAYPHHIKPEALPHISLESYRLCDVIFLLRGVDQTSLIPIPAHRVNVMMRTDVWRQLMTTETGCEISLASFDIGLQAFLALLTVIYNQKYPTDLTEVELLRDCAAQFQEAEIEAKCLEILVDSLEKLGQLSAEPLFAYVKKISTQHPIYNLLTERFIQCVLKAPLAKISPEMVWFVVTSPKLSISEHALLKFIEGYAKASCGSLSVAQYLQQKNWIERVRFEWMSVDEFVKDVVVKDYLLPERCCHFLKLIDARSQTDKASSPLLTQLRPNRQMSWVEVIDKPGAEKTSKILKGRLWAPNHALVLKGKSRSITHTNSIEMFGHQWCVVFGETTNANGINADKTSQLVYGLRLNSDTETAVRVKINKIHGQSDRWSANILRGYWIMTYFGAPIQKCIVDEYLNFQFEVELEV